MAFGKLQSGHWIVAGRCTEPKFGYVGKDNTTRCTAGIAAGKSKTEKDENGYPKTIWINIVAWREMAYILYQAHKGDSVFATGLLHEHEYEGRIYKDIQAEFVQVAQKVDPYANAAPPPAAPAAQNSGQDWTELTDDDDGELPF